MRLKHKRFAVPLRELASQTDSTEFQLVYHDPRIHTSEVADRFGILQSRLSEFAHLLGIPTRRQAGVMWKPTLLRVKPEREKLGPCTPECPEWRRCTSERLWLDVLPCEKVLEDEAGVEYETDASLPYWVMPIEVRVNVEAMG